MNRYEIRLVNGDTECVTSDGFEPHPSAVYVFFVYEPDHTPKGLPSMVASYAIADVKSVRLAIPETEKYVPEARKAEVIPNGYAWTNKDTPNTDRAVDIP
jgi:hypothetical protein